jgi:hypothetical protein
MRRDQVERYFDAPLPTASNHKDAHFFKMVCKRDNGDGIIPSSTQKNAQACRYLPKVTRISFSKLKKKWGYFNDMPETFCHRETNCENFVPLNMLHVV